jgi:hypothetical protein
MNQVVNKQLINETSNSDPSQINNTTLLYITKDNNNVEMEGVETMTNNYYNSCDKLVAAAVAAVSSSSLVEIPNFGDGLTSMIDQQNRMVCIFIFFVRFS